MDKFRYVASCNFTLFYPELSRSIQNYLRTLPDMEIIRCCTQNYKIKDFEDRMPEEVKDLWKETPHYEPFDKDTAMISVCHNCTAVFQETFPDIKVLSLYEFILNYVPDFPYPDYRGIKMTLQDCWRQHDNANEQAAVREILKRMNIEIVELKENHNDTTYCGVSTLRPAPARNLVMAHHRFVNEARGFFEPHTHEEQKAYMEKYCKQITTDAVVAYCHYCIQGFNLVGQRNYHLAELMFAGIK